LNTIPEDSSVRSEKRNATLRRVGVGLLFAFVVASAFLGVRSQSDEAAAGDVHASIIYPAVGRRGLSTPLKLDLALPAPGPVVVWINNSYLRQLDHNSWVPEPTETLASGTTTGLVFEPQSDHFELSLDTRFAPSVTPGRHLLEVKIEAASESIVFELATWVVP
jgi:hypothetical protein